MLEVLNLRGNMAQRYNVKKRDAWPGNEAFVPKVQPVAGLQDLCVCAPAAGSHRDVLDKTAQIHPRGVTPTRNSVNTLRHICCRVRALMKAH